MGAGVLPLQVQSHEEERRGWVHPSPPSICSTAHLPQGNEQQSPKGTFGGEPLTPKSPATFLPPPAAAVHDRPTGGLRPHPCRGTGLHLQQGASSCIFRELSIHSSSVYSTRAPRPQRERGYIGLLN